MFQSKSKREAATTPATTQRLFGGNSSNHSAAVEQASELTPELESELASTIDDKYFLCTRPPKLAKLNDSVWLLREPRERGLHNLDVKLFHGLQASNAGEAFWTTWLSRRQTVIWPQAWLGECFPNARILSISYDSSIEKHDGQMDPFLVVENLIIDLIRNPKCNAGQNSSVVFVGHCLGGLMIKMFLIECHRRANLTNSGGQGQIKRFLKNCKGIFYYATPHAGSDRLTGVITESRAMGSLPPIVEFLKVLSAEVARINSHFSSIQHYLRLATWTIAETRETEFQAFKGELVPEASARAPDNYYSARADHFDVSRARNRFNCNIFIHLHNFIRNICPLERRGGPKKKADELGLEELVRGLRKESNDDGSHNTQRNSAQALAKQTGKASPGLNSKIINTPGALEGLVNALCSDDSRGIKKYCAQALANLAAGDLEICRKIGNYNGALNGLVTGLTEDPPGSPDTKKHSARALANLAGKRDHDLNLKLSTPRALEELVKNLDSDDHPDLQEECARALADFALGDLTICERIGATSACDRLVNVLANSASRPDAQQHSARALADLAAKADPDLNSKITSAPRALEELVNGLYNVDNVNLQKECSRALANLTFGDPEIRRNIRNVPGADEGLRRLARGSDPHAKKFSETALRNLGFRWKVALREIFCLKG